MKLVLVHARAATLELLRYPAFSVPTLAFPALFFLLFVASRDDRDATLLLASFAGFRISEVPTRIRKRSAGQPSTRHVRLVLNYLRLLVVIVSHLTRGRRGNRLYS